MDGEQGRTIIPRTAALTGVASVAPLIVAAILVWTPLAPRALAAFGALVAGAVLLGFLGGVRSGLAIGPYGKASQNRDFTLSLMAMLVALAAFALPVHLGIALLIAGYFLMALWDVLASEDGHLPLWFGKLRSLVCGAAIVALIAVLVRIILG
jgi:hypothetical protein